ncbi:putative hydrolase of the HAD superfamily [Marininema mesophilum]|uniref:Putative hydrolase of the HAD superfamily n=1 Tax=Marininema mesophilum TaxID=1048340 RepID=A0A1H2UWL4_9BACL|nr:HAD-IA family hydrolase [Marininema mesophilum]SDW60463.1 putative hydrolase of the HAD superfamily [Marininema mesophilum]
MIRAVLFDLDETLLNRSASLLRFIRAQYYHHFSKLQDIPPHIWCDHFIQLDAGGYVSKDQVYQQLLQKWPIKGLTCENLLKEYRSSFSNYCVSHPYACQLLQKLQNDGLHTGIITNGETSFQKDNIQRLGLRPFLDEVLVSQEEGLKKPDILLFHRCAERLNVLPNECLYVGDHPVNDIESAHQAGMISIWLQQLAPWPAELPFPKNNIRNLRELLPLLSEMMNKG